MEIREMAERAAQALEIDLGQAVWNEATNIQSFSWYAPKLPRWNPLRYDAACAHMEAFLKIGLEWSDESVQARCSMVPNVVVVERYADHGDDRNTARKYASTRMAVEIQRVKLALSTDRTFSFDLDTYRVLTRGPRRRIDEGFATMVFAANVKTGLGGRYFDLDDRGRPYQHAPLVRGDEAWIQRARAGSMQE